MSELFIITILLLVYILVMTIVHHRQVTQLQRLVKSDSLRDYQEFNDDTKAGSQTAEPRRFWARNHGENQVMQQPNEIAVDDPEFDINKVTQVNVDGEEKPVSII